MGDVEVRRASAADLAALVAVLGQRHFFTDRLGRQQDGRGVLLVAWLDGRPVGGVFLDHGPAGLAATGGRGATALPRHLRAGAAGTPTWWASRVVRGASATVPSDSMVSTTARSFRTGAPTTRAGEDGAMVDEAAFPVLFGTTQATWAPIDLRFQLLTGEVDPDRVARVYVVPFIGAACVVLGFEHGDWGPAGGGLDPGESIRTALERELAEEAGGRLLTYTPFAVLRCHSRAATPYRPHEPHPDYDCLYGYGDVELAGPPQPHDSTERTVAVEVMAPDQAVSFLAGKGRAWEADLYRLAATRRAADLRAR